MEKNTSGGFHYASHVILLKKGGDKNLVVISVHLLIFSFFLFFFIFWRQLNAFDDAGFSQFLLLTLYKKTKKHTK